MKIIRVFPRRTKATPADCLAYYGPPDLFAEADEVHVSVTFTWDMPAAMQLARQWAAVALVRVGGPAAGWPGGEFEPGRYLKAGYVITSRGCPNRCWFCSVWKREGDVRELPIREGWNVLDDNFLACSDRHIRRVFLMLQNQKKQGHRVQFTGGLEAARLQPWHVMLLRDLKPKQIFFAYDTPDDLEPLREAGQALINAGFTTTSHSLRCYVLVGYPGDSTAKAKKRLSETIEAGFMPMAMLYRDETGERDIEWMRFQKMWARNTIVATEMKTARRRRA